MKEFLNTELHDIMEACKQGKTEREIKQEFGLTDWDYKRARKILSCYGVDYERIL